MTSEKPMRTKYRFILNPPANVFGVIAFAIGLAIHGF
jgi:hypothetical protein